MKFLSSIPRLLNSRVYSLRSSRKGGVSLQDSYLSRFQLHRYVSTVPKNANNRKGQTKISSKMDNKNSGKLTSKKDNKKLEKLTWRSRIWERIGPWVLRSEVAVNKEIERLTALRDNEEKRMNDEIEKSLRKDIENVPRWDVNCDEAKEWLLGKMESNTNASLFQTWMYFNDQVASGAANVALFDFVLDHPNMKNQAMEIPEDVLDELLSAQEKAKNGQSKRESEEPFSGYAPGYQRQLNRRRAKNNHLKAKIGIKSVLTETETPNRDLIFKKMKSK